MPPFPLSLEKIQASFEASFLGAINEFWTANLCAAAGWLVISIPTGVFLYYLLIPVFRYFLSRKTEVQQSHFPEKTAGEGDQGTVN